jgi:hypothetical protein
MNDSPYPQQHIPPLLYPEVYITDDLILVDTTLLPVHLRACSPEHLKALLEKGLKEEGYLFVGESNPQKGTSSPYYMEVCDAITLPAWDIPCTLHIKLTNNKQLLIRHLRETVPNQHPVTLHSVSYAEWYLRLSDALIPYHTQLGSDQVSLDDVIGAVLDFIICNVYEVSNRVSDNLNIYLTSIYDNGSTRPLADNEKYLKKLLLGISQDISINTEGLEFYIYSVDPVCHLIDLIFLND